MDTQAQQLILHFFTRTHATFSAAWSPPGLGQDSWAPPVYSISQVGPGRPLGLLLRAQQVAASKSLTYWLLIYLISLCSAGSSGRVFPFSFRTYRDTQAKDLPFHIQLFSCPLKLLPHFILMLSPTQLSSTTVLLPASTRQLAEVLELSPNLKSWETRAPGS